MKFAFSEKELLHYTEKVTKARQKRTKYEA
jgi:hypothetical protein